MVAAGDVYHEYETGPLGYTDPGTERGNALKVRGRPHRLARYVAYMAWTRQLVGFLSWAGYIVVNVRHPCKDCVASFFPPGPAPPFIKSACLPKQ